MNDVNENTETKDQKAAQDEAAEHVYLHFDGIKQSVPWIIKNYYGKGAFSADQIGFIAKEFELPISLVRKLSVYIGNSLDIESEVNLLKFTIPERIKHANENIRRARRLLRAGVNLERVKGELDSLSSICANRPSHAQLLLAAREADDDLEEILTSILNTPGSVVYMKPDDERFARDNRRFQVVMSCCYIWEDAGKELGLKNKLDEKATVDRSGELYEFVKTVSGLVSNAKYPIRGELFHKDITYFKGFRRRRDPDAFLMEEPEFGNPEIG